MEELVSLSRLCTVIEIQTKNSLWYYTQFHKAILIKKKMEDHARKKAYLKIYLYYQELKLFGMLQFFSQRALHSRQKGLK